MSYILDIAGFISPGTARVITLNSINHFTKRRKTMNRKMSAVVTIVILSFGATAFAAGSNGQQGKGKGNGNAGTGTTTTVVRTADSQRRDGTFLTTGTTANGSTVRPGNGKGLMDGTGK